MTLQQPSRAAEVRGGTTVESLRIDHLREILGIGARRPRLSWTVATTAAGWHALGAVADWLHRTVAGLAPPAPGYRRLDIHPIPGTGLTAARARHLTPYGIAESSWTWDAGQLTVAVVIPPNTTAQVTLPGSSSGPVEVGSGRHSWTLAYNLPMALPRDPATRLDEVLSGQDMLHVLRTLLQDCAPTTAARITTTAMMHSSRDRTLREIVASLPGGPAVLERIGTGARCA